MVIITIPNPNPLKSEWQDLTEHRMKGFTGAEKVLRSPSHRVWLVRWNHSQATGWYAYITAPHSSCKHQYYANAGGASLNWTQQQAENWVTTLLRSENIC